MASTSPISPAPASDHSAASYQQRLRESLAPLKELLKQSDDKMKERHRLIETSIALLAEMIDIHNMFDSITDPALYNTASDAFYECRRKLLIVHTDYERVTLEQDKVSKAFEECLVKYDADDKAVFQEAHKRNESLGLNQGDPGYVQLPGEFLPLK